MDDPESQSVQQGQAEPLLPADARTPSAMSPLFMNVLAFLGAMAVSCLCIFLIEALGHKLYPVPDLDSRDKNVLKNAIKNLPLGAFLMVELAYIVGSLVGGYTIAKVAASAHVQLAIALGVFLTLCGIQNQLVIPHPLWFAILTTVTYIPMTWVGAVVLGRA